MRNHAVEDGHYFTGLAEEDELLAHLAKLQEQEALA